MVNPPTPIDEGPDNLRVFFARNPRVARAFGRQYCGWQLAGTVRLRARPSAAKREAFDF